MYGELGLTVCDPVAASIESQAATGVTSTDQVKASPSGSVASKSYVYASPTTTFTGLAGPFVIEGGWLIWPPLSEAEGPEVLYVKTSDSNCTRYVAASPPHSMGGLIVTLFASTLALRMPKPLPTPVD